MEIKDTANFYKENKYCLIKEFIPPILADYLYGYAQMRATAAKTMVNSKWPGYREDMHGTYQDKQIPNTYSQYANMAMETLLLKCQPGMEKATGLKLYPAYTYARIYKKGDELKRHKDRFSCEISTTMNLGGDDWPIYLEPSGEVGKKGIKVDLKQGDMLVYSGCELAHWREKFKGKECVQVFLHYNNRKTPGAKDNMFDKRPHLGLPSWFKR